MKKLIIFLMIFLSFTALTGYTKTESIKMKTLINADRMTENFIKYVKIDTGSDPSEAEKHIPSTERQKDLAIVLAEDLKKLGLKDVQIDKHCVVNVVQL